MDIGLIWNQMKNGAVELLPWMPEVKNPLHVGGTKRVWVGLGVLTGSQKVWKAI